MTKEKHGHGVGGGEVTTRLVECVEVLHGVWPCAVFEYRHSSGFMPTNKWLGTTGFLSHHETMSAILAHTNKLPVTTFTGSSLTPRPIPCA